MKIYHAWEDAQDLVATLIVFVANSIGMVLFFILALFTFPFWVWPWAFDHFEWMKRRRLK